MECCHFILLLPSTLGGCLIKTALIIIEGLKVNHSLIIFYHSVAAYGRWGCVFIFDLLSSYKHTYFD